MNIAGGQSWPRLAGLDAEYLSRQLHDFKSGKRSNASMNPFAAMLSEQQIADVTTYYSGLQIPAAGGGTDDATEALLMRGKQLATAGDWDNYIVSCNSCHGTGGTGVGSQFPGIASQHAGYIQSQLHAWKNGERSNDPQHLMGTIAERLSDEDIQAVAVWFASQTPDNEGDK